MSEYLVNGLITNIKDLEDDNLKDILVSLYNDIACNIDNYSTIKNNLNQIEEITEILNSKNLFDEDLNNRIKEL